MDLAEPGHLGGRADGRADPVDPLRSHERPWWRAQVRDVHVGLPAIHRTSPAERVKAADVPTTGRRPRPCNAVRCQCKWLLFQMRRENAKLRRA